MERSQYINFEEGQKMLSQYHQVFLQRFYEKDLKTIRKSLNSAFSSQNWPEFRRILQGLKGSSSFIGAIKCKLHTEALLKSLSEDEFSQHKVLILLKELQTHLKKLSEYLKSYLSNSDQSETNIANPVEVDKSSDNEKFQKIVIKTCPSVWRVKKDESSPEDYEDEYRKYDELCNKWDCVIS